MENTASGITLREVDASDAVYYNGDEAVAWASGYNGAIDEVRPVVEALQAEVKKLRAWAEDVREAGRLGKINQAGSGRRRGGQ